MKRFMTAVLLLPVSLGVWAQNHKTLDGAIGDAAAAISAGLSEKSRLVILGVEALAVALSEYVVNRLSSEVMNGGRLILVERSPAVAQ